MLDNRVITTRTALNDSLHEIRQVYGREPNGSSVLILIFYIACNFRNGRSVRGSAMIRSVYFAENALAVTVAYSFDSGVTNEPSSKSGFPIPFALNEALWIREFL
jgi:hypothetical protein